MALPLQMTKKTSGFTLIELLIATVVMALLGTALTRILIDDSQFVDKVDAMMAARQVSRAAMSIMSLDFQMVSDDGLVAAGPKSVTVRVPYAFGMICGTTGLHTTASLIPSDSLTYAEATPSGLALRDAGGDYNFLTGITVTSTSDATDCTADSIRSIAGGRLIMLHGADTVTSGTIFYLYENITYSFESSTDLPGTIGLYRRDGSGTKEELLAPFDTSAGFAFLEGNAMTPSSTVTGTLTNVRGLQLLLVGESYFAPQGEADPVKFELITSVGFRNRVN